MEIEFLPLLAALPKFKNAATLCAAPDMRLLDLAEGAWDVPNDGGQWLEFPRFPRSEVDQPAAADRGRAMLRKSREGDERSLHRTFAGLCFANDEQIRQVAANRGPLGCGWPMRMEQGRSVLYGDPPIRSKAPVLRYYEPIATWKAEAANIAFMAALWDLIELRVSSNPNDCVPGSRATYQQVLDETIDRCNAALDYLHLIHPAEHLKASAREWRLFLPISSGPENTHPASIAWAAPTPGPPMTATYSRHHTGEARAILLPRLHYHVNDILTLLARHLRVQYGWLPGARRPQLLVSPNTLLGAIYLSFISETLGEARPVRRCSKCGCLIDHRQRWRRTNYCGQACKMAAYRDRRKPGPKQQPA